MKSAAATLEAQLQATDSGVMSRDFQGLLHSGDKRWTFPTAGDIASESLDQLKAEFAPAMASGPVEVVMVGDITVDKAIEAVQQTFGAIPNRPDPAAPGDTAHSPSFPTPLSQPLVETHNGRADQGIAFVAWPTDGFFASPDKARANEILSRVMQLRLIDVLRLKEGVTYSPGAGSDASTTWPHYGYISAEMEAPPEKLAGFFTDVDAIAADLAANPVKDDELERAKQPALEGLDKAVHTNGYWLASLVWGAGRSSAAGHHPLGCRRAGAGLGGRRTAGGRGGAPSRGGLEAGDRARGARCGSASGRARVGRPLTPQ